MTCAVRTQATKKSVLGSHPPIRASASTRALAAFTCPPPHPTRLAALGRILRPCCCCLFEHPGSAVVVISSTIHPTSSSLSVSCISSFALYLRFNGARSRVRTLQLAHLIISFITTCRYEDMFNVTGIDERVRHPLPPLPPPLILLFLPFPPYFDDAVM